MPMKVKTTVIPTELKGTPVLKENLVSPVDASFTTILEFNNPIRVIKSPIPPEMPSRRLLGMELNMFSLTSKIDIRRKRMPSTKIAVNANCQLTPIPNTTEYVKNAFSPMPGASPIGKFARSPIMIDPNAAARAVAMKTAPRSMPVSPRIEGLTAKIYDIDINVVRPAINSVRTDVFRSSKRNSLFVKFPIKSTSFFMVWSPFGQVNVLLKVI